MLETLLFYFSLLGYQVIITDNVPYGYDAYTNTNDKIVYFTEEALTAKDCFGLTMPQHELYHAYCKCNFHSNGCVFG